MSLVETSSPDPLLPKPKRLKIEQSPSSRNCDHAREGNCTFCKSKLNNGIQVMSHETLGFTKRVNSQTSWVHDKKLHLVLDLDHTLVHTIKTRQLSESDKYLMQEADSRNDLWRFYSGFPSDFLIKVRPFVHQFLKEASEMFSMSVYTKGGCDYAQLVLKLIDPDNTYFGDRVISRRESPGIHKTLDLVLADERGIVIVDDKRCVWPRHKKNLLQIAKYEYFRESSESNSSSECTKKRDENGKKGALASVLSFLKEVHKEFFCDLSEEDLDSMDVRPLLQEPSSRFVERKRKIPAASVSRV